MGEGEDKTAMKTRKRGAKRGALLCGVLCDDTVAVFQECCCSVGRGQPCRSLDPVSGAVQQQDLVPLSVDPKP
jgi:hypothetical protein